MTRSTDTHLSGEEFVDYLLGDLPEDERGPLDAHLQQCAVCTADLREHSEAEREFPAEEFEARRPAFVTRLREALGLSQAAVTGIAAWLARRERQVALLGKGIGLRDLAAAPSLPDNFELSDDGRYGVTVCEDEDGMVHVSVASRDVEAGWVARLTLGKRVDSMPLQGTGTLRASFAIPKSDRRQIDPDEGLRIDIVENGDDGSVR